PAQNPPAGQIPGSPKPPNGPIPASQTPPVQPKITAVPLPPAVVLPSPPQAGGQAPTQPLTAGGAAKIGLPPHPPIPPAPAQVLGAQGKTQEVRSALLPNVTLTGGYSNQFQFTDHVLSTATVGNNGNTNNAGGGGTGGGSNGSGFSANATLSQLIFDFNHTL